MGSKGRIPPHQRRPLPGPGMLHPDAMVSSGVHHPPPGAFPYDALPPPEIMEQKLILQHEEMQRLVIENRRLATTHFTLRQELAAAQNDLQRLQSHMNAVKDEQEQQMRGLLDKMSKIEADLRSSEQLKVEHQQACAEAQGLAAAREDLFLKVKQLTHDLQKSHGDVEQVPALMSELEALRQEYQHCRAVYDYEKKLFTDHYESLQVMERNYVTMVKEVEKLRAELANATSLEQRSSGTYGSNAGYKENDTTGNHSVGHNAYHDGYGVPQVQGPPVNPVAYGGGPPLGAPGRVGHEALGGPGYESYGAPRNASFNPSWGASYDAPKVPGEAPRGGAYEGARGGSSVYDAAPRGHGGGQAAAMVPGGGISGPAYGSGQAPYGPTQTTPPSYGSRQAPNPYGLAQTTPPPYVSGNTPTRTSKGY